jgi:hypothetical protein
MFEDVRKRGNTISLQTIKTIQFCAPDDFKDTRLGYQGVHWKYQSYVFALEELLDTHLENISILNLIRISETTIRSLLLVYSVLLAKINVRSETLVMFPSILEHAFDFHFKRPNLFSRFAPTFFFECPLESINVLPYLPLTMSGDVM